MVRYHRIERAVALAVLVAFLGYFGAMCFKYYWRGDIQRHVASVASLYVDFIHPPHEAVDAPGYTSEVHTPYIVAVAAVGRVLHVSPYRALQLAGVVNLTLYVCAVWVFFRTFSLVSESWLPPLLFLLVSLCMRDRTYFWASETNFQTLTGIQAYPSVFGWAVAIAAFALAEREVRRPSWHLIALSGLVWVLLLSHNLTAVWAIGIIGVVGMLDLVRCGGTRAAWTRVALLYAATAGGVALTGAWPYFDILRSPSLLQFPEGSEFADHPWKDMATLYLLSAVAAVWLIRWRRHTFLIAGFAATVVALWLCRRFGFSYGNRFAFFQAFFAQAAVADVAAVGLLTLFGPLQMTSGLLHRTSRLELWGGRAFSAAVLILSVASPTIASPVASSWRILTHPSAHDRYYDRYRALGERIGPGDVVLMPLAYENWDIPSTTGARVMLSPYAYRLPDFAKRSEDLHRFLEPRCDSRVRAEIIARYHISKVLLTGGSLGLADELGPHETIDVAGEPWILVNVAPARRRSG